MSMNYKYILSVVVTGCNTFAILAYIYVIKNSIPVLPLLDRRGTTFPRSKLNLSIIHNLKEHIY